MKPPRCRLCGVEEWNHVCGGGGSTREEVRVAVERAIARPVLVRAKPKVVKPAVADWVCPECEAKRTYMREYMRRRRAKEGG